MSPSKQLANISSLRYSINHQPFPPAAAHRLTAGDAVKQPPPSFRCTVWLWEELAERHGTPTTCHEGGSPALVRSRVTVVCSGADNAAEESLHGHRCVFLSGIRWKETGERGVTEFLYFAD